MAARAAIGFGLAAVIAASLLLSGCGQKRPAPPVPPIPPTAPAPTEAALDPESYMAFAASSALFAVQASRMAEGRGSSGKIKRYAAQVVMDQTGIGAQLSFAGRRVDLLPSSRPLPRHQAMLEQLANSADFDSTYKSQLERVLREAAGAHRAFEARGDSPTLRPVARFAAPVCEKNLEALRKL